MPTRPRDRSRGRQRKIKVKKGLTLARRAGASRVASIQTVCCSLSLGRQGDVTDASALKGRGPVPPFFFFVAFSLWPGGLLSISGALSGRRQQDMQVNQDKEPFFNVPPVVVGTIVVLILVHVVRTFVLPYPVDRDFLLTFAFIPARYEATLLIPDQYPGGFGAEIWTFVTYAFIHADLTHLGMNSAWFLPFGAALARRFGTLRFLVFLVVTAAAGAAAHLWSHFGEDVTMIGASASISGCMAAAMRFAFQNGGPLSLWRPADRDAYRVPAASLLATFRNPRFLIFLGVWFGINALFGLGSVPIVGEGQEVAWQAHIGGFIAGLVLFGAFDPVMPQQTVEIDTEPTV